MKGPAQVHVEHGVEVLVGHLRQRCAAHIARVVDQDVDAAELAQGRLDDRLTALGRRHRFRAGHRLTTGLGDLADDRAGRPGVGTVAGERAADVVDHDLGPAFGQQQRVLAAKPAAAAGDDGHPVIESQGSTQRISSPSRSPLSRHCAMSSSKA